LATIQTVEVAYQPPAGQNATSIRVALAYTASLVNLPADSTVRERVSATQPRTTVTQVANTNDTLHARVLGQTGGITLAPGPVMTVVFNHCAGAPPPIDADFSCAIEECQPGLQGCSCSASVR
jgi:hypothetical protein